MVASDSAPDQESYYHRAPFSFPMLRTAQKSEQSAANIKQKQQNRQNTSNRIRSLTFLDTPIRKQNLPRETDRTKKTRRGQATHGAPHDPKHQVDTEAPCRQDH